MCSHPTCYTTVSNNMSQCAGIYVVDKAFLSDTICPHSTSYTTVSNTIMWMLSGACALIRLNMVA